MGQYDAVPVPMMGPDDAIRLLRSRFPELVATFSHPDDPDPGPYYFYNRRAEEVGRQRHNTHLVESFCSFINELALSKEHWLEELLGDMIEGLVYDESFVFILRPYLNAQAQEKFIAAGG